MGKYDNRIKGDKAKDYNVARDKLLMSIANELAVANQLKAMELKLLMSNMQLSKEVKDVLKTQLEMIMRE